VLWYGETIRHQGAMECQALYLMGVEPQWNSRGVVDGLRLIPESELGRPRVDVVITVAGIYRDGFPDKMLLLDRAARLVQQAGDNALSRNTRRIAEQLRRQGVAADVAEKAASARIFGPAPGDYGAGIANLIKQSRDAGNTDLIVEAYLRHNNFAYGEQVWGEAVPHALACHLKGNEVVVHSRSTNLYGVTDNDDFFDFAGGLNLATKVVNGGRAPEFYVANLRARGRERLQDFRAFLAAEVNSRFWNPKWIRQMQAAGYSGAREIADQLENLYGWQATTPDKVGSTYWERTYQVYVEDRHGLGLREFFDKQNPHARQTHSGPSARSGPSGQLPVCTRTKSQTAGRIRPLDRTLRHRLFGEHLRQPQVAGRRAQQRALDEGLECRRAGRLPAAASGGAGFSTPGRREHGWAGARGPRPDPHGELQSAIAHRGPHAPVRPGRGNHPVRAGPFRLVSCIER
jgi:hypothetical protein